MSRVILWSPTMGVYLGHAMGLGFWSKMENLDLKEAITFPDDMAAMDHKKCWPSEYPDVVTKPVEDANNDGYASMEECVAAGVEPWSDDERAASHAG